MMSMLIQQYKESTLDYSIYSIFEKNDEIFNKVHNIFEYSKEESIQELKSPF